MVSCSIRKCKSRSHKGGPIRFFSIPKNVSVAKEWLRYCTPNTTPKNGRVCSKHFVPSDYIKRLQHILLDETPRKVRQLKLDAVPTLLLNGEGNESTTCVPTEVHGKNEDISSNMNIHSRPEVIEDGKFRKQLKKVAVPCIYKVIKVTKDGQPKFIVQNMESPGVKLVKVKRESDPVETNEGPPSDEEEMSFDGDHNLSDNQTNVPLSAHPVPMSHSPDPLCDVKVKMEINETGGDGIVGERDRIVGERERIVKVGDSLLRGKPVRVVRAPDGRPLRAPQPPTADLFQTRRTEQKLQKMILQRDRARANLHNVRKTLRRRNEKVEDLRAQLATFRKFVSEHHGNDVVDQLLGRRKSDGMKKQICSVMKDERMKEANRQLLTIERDDRQNSPDDRQESPDSGQESPDDRQESLDDRQESPDDRQESPDGRLESPDGPQTTSDGRQKSLKGRQKSSNIGQKSLLSNSVNQHKASVRGTITNKSEIQQKTSDSKPAFILVKKIHTPQTSSEKIDIPKNRLLVIEPIPENPENSFGTQPTLETQQISDIKTESVDQQICNERISDIRPNDGLRRVVIHPHLVVRQEKSSNIPQEPQINQLKSDIRQKDGIRRLVIYPNHVVRQENSSSIQLDPQIGNERKSDIRQNDGKRRVVIHPNLVVRQEKLPDISQSVSLQPGLVIQIDGMHNSVIPPHFVKLEDHNVDMG